MKTSAYLAAAVVFAVPTQAITETPKVLLNLSSVQALDPAGVELGKLFDASTQRQASPRPPVQSGSEVYIQLDLQPPTPQPKRMLAAPPPPPFVVDVPAAPPAPFQRAFRRLADKTRYDEMIRSHSERLGLDERLVKSVIAAESEFVARAKSPAGALGLMQVMPATAIYMGVPRKALFDPEANIRAGTTYMAHLFKRAWAKYHLKGVPYKSAPAWLVQRIIAAYNAGPRFLARRRLYAQTRDYVRKVLLFYRSRVSELRAVA